MQVARRRWEGLFVSLGVEFGGGVAFRGGRSLPGDPDAGACQLCDVVVDGIIACDRDTR